MASLGNRANSAPQRFSEQTSQYHEHCTSPSSHQRAKCHSFTNVNYDKSQKSSDVVQDEIWKTSCNKERNQQIKWQKNWGFVAEYDQKGRRKEPKQISTACKTLYSSTVPNTSNGQYGVRARSANANFIQRLERTNHNLQKNGIVYCD